MMGLVRAGATNTVRAVLLVPALLWLPAFSPPEGWRDTPLVRAQALALLQGFNAELLSHPSATLVLERWCAAHDLAPGQTPSGRIAAVLDRGVSKPAMEETRRRLGVAAGERVAYRRVRLSCGGRVLSEADNWYVPGRLTPEMNRLLEGTETPFGRVVLPLDFHRRLVEARLLWHPLPEGWERGAALPPETGGPLAIPDAVLEHRAVLLTEANVPFSEVVETYTSELFAFPLAPAAPAR